MSLHLPAQHHLEQSPLQRLLWLRDVARAQGIRIQAASGSGKTLLASAIAFQELRRGNPQVVYDPFSGLIDSFLWRVLCFGDSLSRAERARLFDRIVYVDMSGEVSGHVVPFPLLQRVGDEHFYNVAQRIYNAIIRLDPELKSASIQGANALEYVLMPLVTVLAALGPEWQIGALLDLIAHPNSGRWKRRLEQAASQHPEVAAAVHFIEHEFCKWDKGTRNRNLASLQVKLDPFRYHPALSAIYGSRHAGLDLDEIIAGGKTVCLDFGRVTNQEQRRFGLLWTLFYWLIPFIRSRGAGHHHRPVGLMVDELSALQADTPLGRELLAQDLNELINILRRQFRLWLTLIHQEAYQLDPKVAQNLMSLGTQVLGVSADYESSLATAKQFFNFKPQVKRWEPIYGTGFDGPEVIDYRAVEYSLPELQHVGAQVFQQLRQFHFLARIPQAEGGAAGRLQTLDIRPLLGPFIDKERVAALRIELSKRDGVPIATLLTEIAERNRMQQVMQPDTMRDNDVHSTGNREDELHT